MFRQTCKGVLAVIAAMACLSFAAAEQPKTTKSNVAKAAGSAQESLPKQFKNSISMTLTLVPSGEFMMGGEESAAQTAVYFRKNYGVDFPNPECFDEEHPQHRVRITRPFYLGTYHVTQGQFRQFVEDSGYKTGWEMQYSPQSSPIGVGGQPNARVTWTSTQFSWANPGFEQSPVHPVVDVSWDDAVAFCKWLSKKEGKTYRLPTEAEWEYACRAGTKTRYNCGDDPESLVKVANVADAAFKAKIPGQKDAIKANDGYVATSPAGFFKPNAFGLYDMHGNARQWCADWYRKGYYAKSPVDDPQGPDDGDYRVLRGGSFADGPASSRSAARIGIVPDFRLKTNGFRVAMTP
jgi:formylglycine-generating enzyme required for sulfatase activity